MSRTATADTTPAEPLATTVLPAPIPFRTAATASGHDLMGVMAATVALLLMASLAAWLARRMGWLDRWMSSRPAPAETQQVLRVEQTVRVSRKTTLHRIVDGDRRYLLVESDQQVQWLPANEHGVRCDRL